MFKEHLKHMRHRQIILQSHLPSILRKLGRKIHCRQIHFQVAIQISSRRYSLSPTAIIIGGQGGNSPASTTGDTYISLIQVGEIQMDEVECQNRSGTAVPVAATLYLVSDSMASPMDSVDNPTPYQPLQKETSA
jgi:hypothetical protein